MTEPIDRREFFRSLARYAILGGLVFGAGGAIRRGRRLDSQTCVNGGICSGCHAFEDCGLPQALSAKRARKKLS